MKKTTSHLLLITVGWIALMPSTAQAQAGETDFPITASDGYVLDGRIALPSDGPVEKVIVLLHGSGPQTMDEDLTSVTRDGKSNLFFRTLSDTLSTAGFAVVRYHKRSYQVRLSMQADPAFAQGESFAAFAANPLKYFVDDAVAAVGQVRTRYPAAHIYLLGHSQGAYLALQVADQTGSEVAGLALIGFALSSTDVLVFEQTVYRPFGMLNPVDTDGNGSISDEELASGGPVGVSLTAQKPILDLDADGEISRVELQAGNLSNLMLRDMVGPLRVQEATYPRPAEILSRLTLPIVFFQGLLDNQTPAYNAKAVELVVRNVWRTSNFSFHYFPGLGHALDARDSYDDLRFDTMDGSAKAALVRELTERFVAGV